ncbi:MAG: hypothetical protein GF309_01740 [Candidatus Lokiarchaeota archaeon]|nr:hypothetical protein [Candidatus Lokiarchaeota archaeon]
MIKNKNRKECIDGTPNCKFSHNDDTPKCNSGLRAAFKAKFIAAKMKVEALKSRLG